MITFFNLPSLSRKFIGKNGLQKAWPLDRSAPSPGTHNGFMITLTKFLGMLLMPAGILWIGLLLAAAWAFRGRLRGLGMFLACLWIGFTCAGNLQIGHALVAQLERSSPVPQGGSAPLDALFVLGGGTQVDDEGRPHLGIHGDRLAEAARLWRSGRARRLVASGTSLGEGRSRRNLGMEARTVWEGLGIPAEAIWVVEEPCVITREEIRADRRLAAAQGWSRVGLLSSAWHLPRALALAEREGFRVQGCSSDRRGRIPRFHLWHLVPQSEGLEHTQLACWEWLGRWMGR